LHIASFPNEQKAAEAWERYKNTYPDILGRYSSQIYHVVVGSNEFFRLVAGPVGTKNEADNICTKLKKLNQYCESIAVD